MFEYRGVKLTWLGHNGFRIQNGQVIYIDPFNIADDSPRADIVLVSHEHEAHCSVADLKKIVHTNTIIVAHSQSKDALSKIRLKELRIVKPGDKVTIGDATIEAVPAYNLNKFIFGKWGELGKSLKIGKLEKVFHPKQDGKLGFIVTIQVVRIYHAADTDHIPEMGDIHADIALLPVSGTYVMT